MNLKRSIHLMWAPWRKTYLRSSTHKRSGCFFCSILKDKGFITGLNTLNFNYWIAGNNFYDQKIPILFIFIIVPLFFGNGDPGHGAFLAGIDLVACQSDRGLAVMDMALAAGIPLDADVGIEND